MPELVDIDPNIRGECRPVDRGAPGALPVDRRIAAVAARQHGVVARRQLLALGFSKRAIDHRVAIGRLHPLHHGVYAVGHSRVTPRGRWMAATLACGPRALLGHRSAAALWDLAPAAGASIDVTAPGRSRRGRAGITLHQIRNLDPEDRTERDGIPVTTVARTLLDLAAVVNSHRLGRAFEQAERLQLLDLNAIHRACGRGRGRRGVKHLRALLAEHACAIPETRSELERRFLDHCRAAKLPRPAVNVEVAGFEVDAVWRSRRLVAELDGYEFHRTRAAFERDRARDAALQLAGYRVLRITSQRLAREPEVIIDAVRELLARSAPENTMVGRSSRALIPARMSS